MDVSGRGHYSAYLSGLLLCKGQWLEHFSLYVPHYVPVSFSLGLGWQK